MRGLTRRKLFKSDSKSNIAFLEKQRGVYLIYHKNKLVYIGHSKTNLYKTIMRHFQDWNDPKQERKVYNRKEWSNYTIKIFITTAPDAPILEESLILKYRPRDNKSKIDTATQSQKDRVLNRFKKVIYGPPKVEEWQRFSYAQDGSLLDENGNIIF